MNKINVKLLIPLPGFPSEREINIKFNGKITVLQLLKQIIVRDGAKLIDIIYDREYGSIKPQFGFFVNGTHINYLDGLQTSLKNGDAITIFLVIGGG